MDRLVLDVLGKRRCTWRVHYDVRQDGRRVRRKILVGDHNSQLHDVRSAWLDVINALDHGRDPEADRRAARLAKAERDTHTFTHLATRDRHQTGCRGRRKPRRSDS